MAKFILPGKLQTISKVCSTHLTWSSDNQVQYMEQSEMLKRQPSTYVEASGWSRYLSLTVNSFSCRWLMTVTQSNCAARSARSGAKTLTTRSSVLPLLFPCNVLERSVNTSAEVITKQPRASKCRNRLSIIKGPIRSEAMSWPLTGGSSKLGHFYLSPSLPANIQTGQHY